MTRLRHRGPGAPEKGSALERVQAALRRVGAEQRTESDWSCPLKDNHTNGDKNASLTARYGDEASEKVLLHCAKCGGVDVLLPVLGLSRDDLVDKPKATVRRYVYCDEAGTPLFRVVKLPGRNGKSRTFQERADGHGGWLSGSGVMQGARRPLYRLDELLEAVAAGRELHLTEGESDADALNAWFIKNKVDAWATCHPGGAGKWRPEHTATLRGAARVVVWADADGPGYACAHQRLSAVLAADLRASARLPVAGKDVRDHLAAGHAPHEGKRVKKKALAQLAGDHGAKVSDHSAADSEDDVLALVRAEFLADREDSLDHLTDLVDDDELATLPPVEWVVDRWVPRGTFSVLYGPPGVGKTLALVGMSRAVRRGSRWQDWKTQQGGVLFYQGEGLQQLRDRVRAWDERYPLRGDQRMAPGKYRQAIFDLTKEESVAAVVRTVRALEAEAGERFSMVVIDPLVEFMTGEENREGMQLAARGLRALARILDCAVVVGHHTNADGSRERGALFLRMRAASVMRLDRPEDTGELGLMQEKNRFDERQAIGLQMVQSGPGVVLEWTGMALAEDYAAEQKAVQSKRKAEEKKRQRAEASSAARQRALDVVRGHPGISKTQAFAQAGGNRQELYDALDALVREKRIRREPGPRQAQFHWLVEEGQP